MTAKNDWKRHPQTVQEVCNLSCVYVRRHAAKPYTPVVSAHLFPCVSCQAICAGRPVGTVYVCVCVCVTESGKEHVWRCLPFHQWQLSAVPPVCLPVSVPFAARLSAFLASPFLRLPLPSASFIAPIQDAIRESAPREKHPQCAKGWTAIHGVRRHTQQTHTHTQNPSCLPCLGVCWEVGVLSDRGLGEGGGGGRAHLLAHPRSSPLTLTPKLKQTSCMRVWVWVRSSTTLTNWSTTSSLSRCWGAPGERPLQRWTFPRSRSCWCGFSVYSLVSPSLCGSVTLPDREPWFWGLSSGVGKQDIKIEKKKTGWQVVPTCKNHTDFCFLEKQPNKRL